MITYDSTKKKADYMLNSELAFLPCCTCCILSFLLVTDDFKNSGVPFILSSLANSNNSTVPSKLNLKFKIRLKGFRIQVYLHQNYEVR